MTLKNQKYLRIKDWWSHILPPILLFFYIGIPEQGISINHLLFLYILNIVLSIITAIIGYFLNDQFDIKDDLVAGKPNFVSTLSTNFRYLFSIFMVGCTILFFYICHLFCTKYECHILQIFFILNIVLFILYSVPPIRLKSYPFSALFADALYSGTLYYIMAYLINLKGKELDYMILICLFIFGLSKGIRNYLTHISLDEENDKKCNQNSLATIFGKSKIQYIANLIFPFELILIFIILSITHYGIAIPVLLLSIIYFTKWVIHFNKSSIDLIPELNDLYEMWLPVLLLVHMILLNHVLYPLLIIHTLLFPNYLDRIYYYTFYKFIGPLRKKNNEGK